MRWRVDLLRVLLALFILGAGVVHLVRPEVYLPIVPPSLPWPGLVVLATGVCEILLGAGLLWRRTRRAAAYGLVAYLIAVFPANVHMAVNGVQIPGADVPTWMLWARLPAQLVLIAWAAVFARRRDAAAPAAAQA